MATIIEKWPDMSTLPDWANEAIETGHLFQECFRRINLYKEALEDIRDLAVHYDCLGSPKQLKGLVDDMGNIAVKAIALQKWTETVGGKKDA